MKYVLELLYWNASPTVTFNVNNNKNNNNNNNNIYIPSMINRGVKISANELSFSSVNVP